MADDITLRIDGVDWTYWTSVQVSRQMDAIAGTFSLSLADKWVNGAQALPIAAGMACQILIGGDQVMDGYIDQVRPSFSATAHGISITGRDKSADLVDCAAIHSPGQWLDCTVLQLAQALAGPFGVSVTAEGDVGAPLASFKLEEGETAFEALDRALRQRGLMACPDGRGGIVLLKAGADTAGGSLRQGENILAAEGQFDMADRFSDYIVKGQKPGTDTAWGKAACAVRGEYRDQAVRRYRPMLIRAEQSGDAGNARQRAAWECSVRAARAVTVTATVQGFRQQGAGREQSGPLWQLNQMVDVDLPYLRISQRLLVTGVEFRRDAGSGSTTRLTLRDPAAFAPEPGKKETSDGSVTASACRADSESVFANRSERRRSVVSRAVLDAKRLAMTLPAQAATATSSIRTLHSARAGTLRAGATSSIMCAMMSGRNSSASVPATLKASPAATRFLDAARYENTFFTTPLLPPFLRRASRFPRGVRYILRQFPALPRSCRLKAVPATSRVRGGYRRGRKAPFR